MSKGIYIIIDEVGKIYKSDTMTDVMVDNCSDGYITIIDTNEPVREYDGEKWINIEEWLDE